MRVHVDTLDVIAPTSGSLQEANATATSNGVFYGVIHGIARPFREPGVSVIEPLPPAPAGVPRFDTNPERLRVDSDGQVGASRLEVTTGALVTNLTGVLDFGFRTYSVLPDPAPVPMVTGNRPSFSAVRAAGGRRVHGGQRERGALLRHDRWARLGRGPHASRALPCACRSSRCRSAT